ncbi:MAG TPA: hypothetical protein VE992_01205 [Solirubrobacteraceae bacterium]|nr:hypothetical protein [Solirubrobacteraceae bacterium]
MIAVGALAVAGCGSSSNSNSSSSSSSGSSSSSSSTTLTHSQLVAQANALCSQRNAQVSKLPKALAHPSSLKQAATYLGDVASINGPLLAKFHALKPPASDQATWSKAMADNDAEESLLNSARTAAASGNAAAVQSLITKAGPISKRLQTEAAQLGLTQCLVNPTPSG